jgi:hypothetical protein
MANSIDQVVSDAADKLIQAIDAYGPKASALVLETGRMAALQEIIVGFTCLVLVGLCIVAIVLGARGVSKALDADRYAEPPVPAILVVIAGSIVGAVSLIGALTNLINVIAWVGLTHPEIYLAAKLLRKL